MERPYITLATKAIAFVAKLCVLTIGESSRQWHASSFCRDSHMAVKDVGILHPSKHLEVKGYYELVGRTSEEFSGGMQVHYANLHFDIHTLHCMID